MKEAIEQPLYMTQNFNQWVKGKCNTLDRAIQKASRIAPHVEHDTTQPPLVPKSVQGGPQLAGSRAVEQLDSHVADPSGQHLRLHRLDLDLLALELEGGTSPVSGS